jgi:hypothetical protein
VIPVSPDRADTCGAPHATSRPDRSDRDFGRRGTSLRTPVRWRMVRTATAPAAATATPPARSQISVTSSGSTARYREAQGRLCATGEDRLWIACSTRCVREETWACMHRDQSEPGKAQPPGAECSLPRSGHAVSRSGPRGVALTPPAAQRRAHRDMRLHDSGAITRPDTRNRIALTAAPCRSTRVRLLGGGSCSVKAHENRLQPPRGCHGCGLSWGWADRGLSTSTSFMLWTMSGPSRSSRTAKSARACSCRPSAGPGLDQVARGSAVHRRARRGHTTNHTPADRLGGDPCTARRRTSSASPFMNRAGTSEQPSGLLPIRIPS